MFTIGEFSRLTGLTVKTLRFYQEQGILPPSAVDDHSGYRYYAADKIETARVIKQLRGLEISLADIAEILAGLHAGSDVLEYLAKHKQMVAAKAAHYRQIESRLNQLIRQQQEARSAMTANEFEVEEKTIATQLIAGTRMRGRYSDCGKGFSQIGRKLGRFLGGPCFLLHYDTEYREDDADFEACFPLRRQPTREVPAGISVRELMGGPCISLLHKGPYEELGRSYQKIISFAKSKNFNIEVPSRELYLKGPGMIFKGNPQSYLTEIQMLLDP